MLLLNSMFSICADYHSSSEKNGMLNLANGITTTTTKLQHLDGL